MNENFKPQDFLYKPHKSASAVANSQSAVPKRSTGHEETTRRAKTSLDGIDIGHTRKSAEFSGWPSSFERDSSLNNLSRFNDGLSLRRPDGWEEGRPHGPLCRCTSVACPIDQVQDVAALRRVSSISCRSDDWRNWHPDWNPMEPFPKFESRSGVEFACDVPVLRKSSLPSDQIDRSYDAFLSAITMKLETQNKIIDKLHNGLKRLEDDRDAYTQLFRELRDEMISLNGRMIDTQANSSFYQEISVWKNQIVTEMHHLNTNVNRFHDQGRVAATEHSNRIAQFKHELSETKKFLSDEVEANRREIRKLLSRIGQLEVDMVGVFSENKNLHSRLQKVEQTMLQSQAILDRGLTKIQTQQTKDRTDLERLQRSHGCHLQKLHELTLKSDRRSRDGRSRKDLPSAFQTTPHLGPKTGGKSRLSERRMQFRDHDDLCLDMMSESSSLTSLTDTLSTDDDNVAESCRGKKSSVSDMLKELRAVKTKTKMTKAKKIDAMKTKAKKRVAKRNSKSITKTGCSSELMSPIPDMDTSDSLTEINKASPNIRDTVDQVADTERNPPLKEKRLSGTTAGNVTMVTGTTTTTSTSSTSSSSSTTSLSSSSSSSSTSSTDLPG